MPPLHRWQWLNHGEEKGVFQRVVSVLISSPLLFRITTAVHSYSIVIITNIHLLVLFMDKAPSLYVCVCVCMCMWGAIAERLNPLKVRGIWLIRFLMPDTSPCSVTTSSIHTVYKAVEWLELSVPVCLVFRHITNLPDTMRMALEYYMTPTETRSIFLFVCVCVWEREGIHTANCFAL